VEEPTALAIPGEARRRLPIKALDVILFRRVDAVSHAIGFLEAKGFGRAPDVETKGCPFRSAAA
jgi:hypothetical protein